MRKVIFNTSTYTGNGEEFGDIPVPKDYIEFMRKQNGGYQAAPMDFGGEWNWPKGRWIIPPVEIASKLYISLDNWKDPQDLLREMKILGEGNWRYMFNYFAYNENNRCIAVCGDGGGWSYIAGFHRSGFYFITSKGVMPDDSAYHYDFRYHQSEPEQFRSFIQSYTPYRNDHWAYYWVGKSFAELLEIMETIFDYDDYVDGIEWDDILFEEIGEHNGHFDGFSKYKFGKERKC